MTAPIAGAVAWPDPTLVISLDFELAWGSFDHAYGPELLEMARWTHDYGAPALLGLLTRNGLSATWAVVGLAMLDRLPDTSQLVPYALPDGRDWLSFVPSGATEETAREWFGASFVRRLLDARPPQEVGFHGYSHVQFGDPRLPPGRGRQEIERCSELARRFSLGAPSFVFPRNSVGFLDALRAAGIPCFRGEDEVPRGLRRGLLRKLWSLGADVVGLTPPLVQPRIDRGLVDIPGSLMVRYHAGWRKHIPDRVRARRLRAGLERVQRQGGIFHVWLHPENLYFERPRLELVLAEFLAEAGELAAASRLRVLTMGDVARELSSHPPSGAYRVDHRE